tara:strand:- start:513 stop:974 length:462 start_codon:yes stop_codon:yes gene_type:complete
MRKIPFYLIIFLLTTGFLKSPLEKCADEKTRSFDDYNRNAEYRKELKSEKELKELDKIGKEKRIACEISKKSNNKSALTYECLNYNQFLFDSKYTRYNQIKIRDISESENIRKYKAFIRQSLKSKIRVTGYEYVYSQCIKEQKDNPKLFDAKY